MKAAVRKAAALVALIGVTAVSAASGAEQPTQGAAIAEIAPSTTVATANTAALRDLSKEMKKAQDHFLELYNKVNHNLDQRLSCTNSAPTGTRLSQHSCSTRAQTRATEEMARNYMGAVDGVATNVAQRDAVAAQASANAQNGVPLTAEQTASLSGGGQTAESSVDIKSGETTSKVAQQKLDFEQNLQELLQKNPELRQRYEDYLEARQRYLDAGGRI
jgi:hypothetical protein